MFGLLRPGGPASAGRPARDIWNANSQFELALAVPNELRSLKD
ncbi:MAG: hypothetical protein WCP70_12810 [Methanothrix sp.]